MSTVKDILASKGREVWSVAPSDSVLDALRIMAAREVGALPVMDGWRLVGILSERDYARKVILAGRASVDTRVSEVMTRRVLCVTPAQSVGECMALMTEQRARHLPVVERKRVVGLVSIGDLVKAHIEDQEVLIDQLKQYIAG